MLRTKDDEREGGFFRTDQKHIPVRRIYILRRSARPLECHLIITT